MIKTRALRTLAMLALLSTWNLAACGGPPDASEGDAVEPAAKTQEELRQECRGNCLLGLNEDLALCEGLAEGAADLSACNRAAGQRYLACGGRC